MIEMWDFSSLGILRTKELLSTEDRQHAVFNKKKGSDDLYAEEDRTDSPVGRCRSQSKNRRVAPSASIDSRKSSVVVEKVLQNGDVYSGGVSSNVPHGSGKYLWMDGCMYEGEWWKGKPAGSGKFSWPSGASYVGDFKAGRMEGFGTFIGCDGDTYRGYWVGDRKEGFGQKRYANGDYYEGAWKRNVQDGEGRYVWANGDEYKGECRNGMVSGRGVLVRANGSKFEGVWEKGVLKGSNRTVMFGTNDEERNGDEVLLREICYDGIGKGNGGRLVGGDNVRTKSSVDGGARGSLAEKPFPRICLWESDGEAGDITCDIIDNLEASMFYHDGTGLEMGSILKFPPSEYFMPNEVKKPGQTVLKGHKTNDLMLNLQLGIRYSVGKHVLVSRELKPSDFEPKGKLWLRFPPGGSKITPPHQSTDFRWKDYCPMVFRHLRELFQVDPADYMLAICGSAALRELSSPGKSGSLFYLTQDDKYMIKTVRKSEVKVLIKMLPSYCQHMRTYENTLVTKFFGVHCVKSAGGQKTRFIVMGNLFCSDLLIHKRFDLKGSSHGRSIDKQEGEIDEKTTFKDLDLNYVFRLQSTWFQELIKQIELDCRFLEAEKIMDYSLLVGVHFRDDNAGDKIRLSRFQFGESDLFLEAELVDRVASGRKPRIRLGSNMPAIAERMVRKCDGDDSALSRSLLPSVELHDVVLYFGIIDILQDYDITKKIEHAYKSFQADPTSISAVDPKLYSKRFQEFIKRIFIEYQKIP